MKNSLVSCHMPATFFTAPFTWQLFLYASFACSILLGSCQSETLLHADFENNNIGQVPLTAQKTGTVAHDGPAGSVVVTGPPPTLSGRWVKITRFNQQNSVSALQGKLSQFRGEGVYDCTAMLYIPSGSEVTTLQFETFSQPANDPKGFLHLDFLQNNQVRIDDGAGGSFGTFPRDKIFMVKVTLDINATAPFADISLAGDGASGTAHREIFSHLRNEARQFGALRLWVGFPWVGSFSATNIVVKRQE